MSYSAHVSFSLVLLSCLVPSFCLFSSGFIFSCFPFFASVLFSSFLVLSLLFQSPLILFYSLFVSSSLVVFCLFSVSCRPLIYLPVSSPLIFHFLSLLLFSSYSHLVLSRLVSCLNSSHHLVFLLASSWSFIFLSPLCLVSFPHSPPVSSPLILFSLLSHLVLFSFCFLSHPVLSCSLLVSSVLIASLGLLVVCPVSSHLNFSHSLGSSSCLLLVYSLGSYILVLLLFYQFPVSFPLLFAHSPLVHIVLPQFLSFSPLLFISPLSLLSHHIKDKKTRLEETNQDHESRFLVFASVHLSFSSCLVPSRVSSHISISSLISSHPLLFTHTQKKFLLISYCLFSSQFLSFSCLHSVSSCLTFFSSRHSWSCLFFSILIFSHSLLFLLLSSNFLCVLFVPLCLASSSLQTPLIAFAPCLLSSLIVFLYCFPCLSSPSTLFSSVLISHCCLVLSGLFFLCPHSLFSSCLFYSHLVAKSFSSHPSSSCLFFSSLIPFEE